MSTRLPSLTGLRGIAAIAVMLFHFSFAYLPQAGIADALPVGRAHLSVDLFFLLSGFVMAHVYGDAMAHNWREALWPFVRARFARIYPLFAVTTIATVLIVMSLHVTSKYVTFSAESLALYPLLLQSLHYGLSWNYPSWSISTEAMAYAGFIPGAAILLRWKMPWLFAAVFLAMLLALALLKGGVIDSGSQLPAIARTAAGFGLGVLLWRAWRADRKTTARVAAWMIVPLIVLEMVIDYDFLTIIALGCVLILALEDKGFIAVFLNSRPMEALGDWSYSIYLWHAPVHFAVQEYSPVDTLDQSGARVLAGVTAALVVVLSALSYRFVEVPARRALTKPPKKKLA